MPNPFDVPHTVPLRLLLRLKRLIETAIREGWTFEQARAEIEQGEA